MILNTDDVNTQVDILNANFINCLNECGPLVTNAHTYIYGEVRIL